MINHQLYYKDKLSNIVKKHFNEAITNHNHYPMKTGMTNSSFYFITKEGNEYVIRINGLDTNKTMDRYQEYLIYQQLNNSNLNISDNIYIIDYISGYKITEYIANARVCNPHSKKDLSLCMDKLRILHDSELYCSKTFDIVEQINFYKSMWNNPHSKYDNHDILSQKIQQLIPFINNNISKHTLSHIDSISDNFLIKNNQAILIDWEYASMCDPDIDIAMFALYSMYSKEQLDYLIDVYYKGNCPPEIRQKIYCYMSLGGLLWSNWCEFKEQNGATFGKYATWQFLAAENYYQIATKSIK